MHRASPDPNNLSLVAGNSRRSSTHSTASTVSSQASSTASSSSQNGNANLEVVAPVTSDVEFKYTWPIDGFLKKVKRQKKKTDAESDYSENNENGTTSASASNAGLDSAPFDINVNGVKTTWNLSVRFWIGEGGERLANPFVLCLNMLSCAVDSPVEDVAVRYRFGVLNRATGVFEMGGTEEKSGLCLESTSELKSVGYKNIAVSDQHVDSESGDMELVCKMKLVKEDRECHSLSSGADFELGSYDK